VEHDVAALRAQFALDRRMIDREMARLLGPTRAVPPALTAAMRYAVLGPGKRLRPILALEAFKASGGGEVRRMLPFCAGIEMVHAFSLVHDDLPAMDDDDFRRGRPSLHRRFGEGLAILAADALVVRAFELFATGPAPARHRLVAMAEIARAVGPSGMVAGQVLDIAADGRGVGAGRRAARGLATVHRKKTALFIAGSMVVGAVLAGAPARVRDGLRRAGLAIGRLFQLTDDLLDATARGRSAERANAVGLRGEEAVRRMAAREARTARRLLNALGRGYGLLAATPAYVLMRKS